ncbi:Cenp-O kinetochore centromere component-domain-containing protein [Massariosphaeria phaeospora]|uniref:Cenp-O kinetochore centromere component-domain-containing protein n=1 Tax=Massariosphaeria phaeospora TaxID=100035 RepID=A0A7C8IDL0_9PLEO|nr:Cenp-O kinetochore centromere component-domain-containing protein [Massariosphaeria phaeospora]
MEALDCEINDIHARIADLRAQRANLSAILLSQPHLPTRLSQRPVANERRRLHAAKLAKTQHNRNLENVYRACAGITAYKVKDPDPHAIDNGMILGVRIDVSIRDEFVETYHVLFVRPSAKNKSLLRIHKHTIPPCVALQPLANLWLPTRARDGEGAVEQNLVKFGRALRKELVSWHLRGAAVEKLRAAAGVTGTKDREEQKAGLAQGRVLNAFVSDDEDSEDEEEAAVRRNGPLKITAVDADISFRELSLLWSNGQTAIMKVTKDGDIEMAAVRTEQGARLSSVERKAKGRIEGLLERLAA